MQALWESSMEHAFTHDNRGPQNSIGVHSVNIHSFRPTATPIITYFTRFSHQYRSHPARLKIKQLSINCLGPVLCNSLPEVIRKSLSMCSFKLSVKKFIIFNKN